MRNEIQRIIVFGILIMASTAPAWAVDGQQPPVSRQNLSYLSIQANTGQIFPAEDDSQLLASNTSTPAAERSVMDKQAGLMITCSKIIRVTNGGVSLSLNLTY